MEDWGIVTLVSPLQPENAEEPMLVIDFPSSAEGIVTAPVGEGQMAAEPLL